MKSTVCFTLLSLLPTLVSAHGYVSRITVNHQGEGFKGNTPYQTPDESIVRQITTIDPVKGADNPDINCGPGSEIASEVLKVMPGDRLAFQWHGGGDSQWPHNTGPMMTYMASCGDKPCNEFDSHTARWFKIEQTGRTAPGGPWYQHRLLDFDLPANVTLPGNIQPGNYLIRHEIIALHLGENRGGAEFYPSCAQLEVGGNGNGKPTEEELVSFPGAYTDDDPGVHSKNIWNFNAEYVYPGPRVAKFAAESGAAGDAGPAPGSGNGNGGNGNGNGSGSGSNDDEDEEDNDSPSDSGSENGTNGGNGNDGSSGNDGGNDGANNGSSESGQGSAESGSQRCRLKKSSSALSAEKRALYKRQLAMYKPKHISRIMRSIDWSSLSIH